MIKRYNIVVGKPYTTNNGEEKKQWNNVGTLVYFPANGDKVEGYKLELSMFPNVNFSVFEQKPREAGDASVAGKTAGTQPAQATIDDY